MQKNDKKGIGLLSSRGVNQNERTLKALMPEYARVDERSVSDLLAFAVKFSEIVQFHNIGPKPEPATWAAFFKNDLSLFLATIIATDTGKIEREHNDFVNRMSNSPRADDKLEALQGLFLQVTSLAQRLDTWYQQSLAMNSHNPLDSNDLEIELENAIRQQLSIQLQQLLDFQRDLGFQPQGALSEEDIRERFHPIWFRKNDLLGERALKATDVQIEDKIKYYSKQIRLLYRSFYSVLSYIIQISPKYLEKSLTEKTDHRPDMAMYMAFVHLFQHNQAQINTLTEKHLDFYYYDVLKLRERGFTPDKVNIHFSIAQQLDSYLLRKGTVLEAGRDDEGNLLYFETDYDIELNQTQIAQLRTVYVSKNPKISSGIGSSYRIITNLYAAPIANSRNGQGEPFVNGEEDWPTFGEEMLDKSEYERQMTFADLGWALSAPILDMEEGHRIVTYRLEFDKASMYTLLLLIKDIAKKQEGESGDAAKEDTFTRIFRDSITVFYTTPNGWTKANTCEVLPPDDWSKPELTIVTTLNAVAPAVTPYDPLLHGNGYDTAFPIVKFMHKNIDTIFSYSFLKELLLEKVFVDVTVKGMKNLALFSDVGPLDASMPFQPFGPVPKVGSYLIIGKAELFKKDLTDLKINLEWHNLPDHKRGLQGYYKEYGLGIQNDSYKVRFSALSAGNFFPSTTDAPETQPQFRLFHEAQAKDGLEPVTTFDSLDLKLLNIKPDFTLQLPPVFNNNARSGYFKMELTAPKVAFGHDDFAAVYTHAVSNNANPRRREELPVPKQPYTPTVKTLTIDYSASTHINIISIGTISKGEYAVEQLYHIHPFGIIRTYHEGRMLNRSLVPTYDEDAYLYIGLRGMAPPCTLSLYFELRENQDLFSFDKPSAKPEIIWSYMVNDEWRDFTQTSVLSDTTHGFNNSGIVSLDVPRDLTRQNHILPAGLHWIRVAVKGDSSKLGRTLFVTTQAVSATWVNRGNNLNRLDKRLPSNSILRLATPVTQVRSVAQPFPSFGGRPGETKRDFYTRTSERLRHKRRAVSAWDFERLVLEQFPFIFQVKCVTHMTYPDFVKPGTVVLVVIPRTDNQGKFLLPRVSYTVLQQIKEYLEPLASPFIQIEVRNPVYERLKISCGVRFEKGKNNGTFLKELNRDIMEFLCPWVVGRDRELDLGGSVTKDSLLNFIEQRNYIEFVTKFSVVQVFANERGFDVEDTAIDSSSSPVVYATKPWAVLIPFETNPIYLMDEVHYQAPDKSAVDSMIISGDFVVTEEKDTDFDFTKKK